MMLLKAAPSPLRVIEDDFNAVVADLNGQPTSNRISRWSRLTGSTIGTSGGRLNTSTTTNTIYTLEGSYGAFKATLNFDESTGGDAFYFRIQDANNWIRVREYSEQSATTNGCSDFQTGQSTFDWGSGCSGLSTTTPYYAEYGTTSCGNTVLTSYGHVWEIRPDCAYLIGPSPPAQRLRSQILVSYTSVTYSQATRFYRTVLERMVNGNLQQIQLGGTSTTSTFNSSNTGYVSNTSYAVLPSRTLTVEATPTTIKVSGYSFSVNINDSSFSGSRTVGIGRGSSSTFTTSGLTNFKLET